MLGLVGWDTWAVNGHFVEQHRELDANNCYIRSCDGVVIQVILQLWGVMGRLW